ncbi:hypothetical protein H8S23_13000 [Anaerofilum sp. BX8]|uniref:HPr family phosphocarrier protein n=1 Tax=Anaerofilum hominis TaxID=2763016 RepID=A0A923RFD7_9FIRM|nr:hypothetical protein [Anaerofilum hominis]MBC5582424.1 hypothetical protein [Anaerofilum hominis]
MVSKKKFNTISELQKVQFLATQCPSEVGLHSEDGETIIDAKSYIGMYALDFDRPILVVSEDEDFHKKIGEIGENLPLDD